LATPFLLLLVGWWRRGDGRVIWPALATAALVLYPIWMHGNTGGWQFSYRYGLVIFPWLFVVLIQRLPARVQWYEASLWLASAGINVFATYLFLWSGALK
jgi:hypothetical protein